LFDLTVFAAAADVIVDAGRFLYQRGWSPATSSNYSARIDAQHIAITVSGRHKGELSAKDVMVVDLEGKAVQSQCKPSAETRLHTAVYSENPEVGAVLHTHSVGATVLSRVVKRDQIAFSDYELQKAFSGVTTHEGTLAVPIFENTQDIDTLARHTQTYMRAHPEVPAYFIRGHGVYTWGATMTDCLRHIEALEFLVECELEMRRIQT